MAKSKSDGTETLRFLMVTRGVITVLFGIMALVWPGLTVLTFATLLVLWLLASGVINIVRGIMAIGDGGASWILTLMLAAVQLGVGAYLTQRPQLTIATMVALLAIAFIVEGVIALVSPFVEGNRDETGGQKAIAIIYGVLALIAGIAIWRYPVSGTLAFVWIVGLFALISGPMWIAVGLSNKD